MKPDTFMPPRPHCNADRGFTLVELMIALTLGLLIVAGVVNLFLGMRASYSFQEGLSRVQENGRFAIHTLGADLRMAGYQGCANPETVSQWIDPTGTGYSEARFGQQPVTGWEASGTGIGDSYEIGSATNWSGSHGETIATGTTGHLAEADLVPGSDVLMLNRSTELDLDISGPPSSSSASFGLNSENGVTKFAVILAVPSSCNGGDYWQKQSAPTSNTLSRGSGGSPGNTAPSSTPFDYEYDQNAMLLTRISELYTIQRNPSGEPALYRQTIDSPSSAPAEELVSGVESMQLLFGEDTDDSGTADTFSSATGVGNWNAVVAVRIGLLLRNENRVPSEAELRPYSIAHTQITPVEEGRVRQVMTLTAALRNRLP